MEVDFALTSLARMFELSLKIALPLLIAALISGIVVSVVQVVTQIQEMTLTFVPKILVCVAVLAFAGHWMLNTLVEYSRQLFLSIASM
ncbi:flagellar biosynthetic protein FliQ [Catenovulum sp. SM1970]|uniref:flagellar biosynthetic protein FliQ n=1 Tax=Marinifaba aquimaris TaxID=2741323 RepID=UPI00157487CB|nr:flagellar biosynthetic protein FliQ [Marinifaba aquimaris]NTS77398.1 flagellar biosynthetic protein FliQ [Marinifaba aquimaris]